ncbi:MAG: IclR family transcriptional regulator [Chloroflexota bacterium]
MIQSVERAFSLLYTIGHNKERVTISQLARDVGLPRTTVVRLLDTLQAVGAVKSADHKDTYQLGDKMLALLSETSWTEQIVAIAQPSLQKLAEQTGETIYFCLPDGDWCYFAAQINTRYKIRIEDSTGERHPLHITSAGKLFLAHRSQKAQALYFEHDLVQYTAATRNTLSQLQQQFAEIVQYGICWNHDEYEIGYTSVAAPIYNSDGDVVAAPAVGAPKFRIRDKAHETEMARLVCEAAQAISKRLQTK